MYLGLSVLGENLPNTFHLIVFGLAVFSPRNNAAEAPVPLGLGMKAASPAGDE
ncbi:MAG: hypothetical protein OJF49_002323 [Ktedonobacterales bacterium]|jgi:hypothetical protein|nr:MAG: hypothetical protein OJF49_002323 [Ktedonobacterales bacterium]